MIQRITEGAWVYVNLEIYEQVRAFGPGFCPHLRLLNSRRYPCSVCSGLGAQQGADSPFIDNEGLIFLQISIFLSLLNWNFI